MLNLVNAEIRKNSLYDDLKKVLDSIDSDFTGANGEEYFADNGKSILENTIEVANKLNNNIDKITYILDNCKNYSDDYYNEFEFNVVEFNDIYYITVATVCI